MKYVILNKLLATVLFTAASIGTLHASTITVGGPSTNPDCTFACVDHYQQVYSSSSFAGPVTINSISFTVSDPSYGGTWAAGNSWQMSVSTSANPVNALNATFTNNLGGDNVIFATQSFSGTPAPGSLITFTGLFNYNPMGGDLLVDIKALGTIGGPGGQFSGPLLDANSSASSTFSRVYEWNPSPTGYVMSSYGNVTQFGISAVPVPAAAWLLGSGLLGLIGVARRKAA